MLKLIFVISLLFSFNTYSAEKPLKVGIFNISPFGQTGANGDVGGVIAKFLDLISQRTGIKFTYQLLPYPRMKSYLSQNKIQLAMFYPDQKNSEKFVTVCPSLGNENLIVLEKKLTPQMSSLNGRKIATIRNAKYDDKYDNNEGIIKVPTENYEQGLELLRLNRVDGVVIPAVALKYHLKNSNYNPDNFKNSFVLNHKQNCLHFHKSVDEKKINKIRSAHDELINTQKLKRLSDLI